MRKTNLRKDKGITLIALVITIIVLLILAGVAISMLSGENGILTKAAEAKTKTEEGQTNEAGDLTDLEILIEESTGNLKNVKDYPKNKKVEGKKVKLQDDNGETIVIPVGFKIKEDSPTEVKKGIVVVAPDGSEFVWVPVKDVSKMYGTDENGRKLGKLYDWTPICTALNWTETNGKMSWIETEGNREPDYLSDATTAGDAVTGDNTKGIGLLKSIVGLNGTHEEIMTKWKTQLQNEFDQMIKSVEKNKGFYVGRYETSLNESKNAQSISGATSATAEASSANTWYGLYQKEKEYSEKNKLTNVVGSSMIWGSQYDQMMIWMQGNGIDVTSDTPINLEGVTTSANAGTGSGVGKTGTVSTDKLNNIYDLLGNGGECTLESQYTFVRVQRGGSYGYEADAIQREGTYSYMTDKESSSRITLYIK